jgi:hypothetical protein
LRAHALKPAPEIVKRRLAALDADLPRRREWVQAMEAESQRQRDRLDGAGEWRALFSGQTNPWRAVLLALVIWFVWWLWPRH